MTEHDKPQTASGLSPSDKSDQRGILASSLRRRLVKGTALALPAIITLPRVEANAMVSITCKVKQGQAGNGTTGGATVVTTTDGPDYVRQTVAVYDSTGNPGTPKYYLDSVMNVYRDYTTGDNLGAAPGDLGTALSDTTYYALAFVDGNGTVVALGPGTSPSAPVSDNCFASV